MSEQPIPSSAVLSVRNLTIEYKARRGKVQAVRDISFDLQRGEVLALIGESGSGKTTVSLGLVQLLPGNAKIASGKVVYQRRDPHTSQLKITNVLDLKQSEMRAYRWQECAMVFQSALNSLNP